MKNIVICCDGTWNTPGDRQQGIPVPTNVVRIFNAVARTAPDGRRQHKYYHPGVGTDGSWWDKVSGGGTGAGLDRNIMSAYRELCEHYRPDDDIFLFGFSRGAYTVRSLAGLIGRCGILDMDGLTEPEKWSRIGRVFERGYRRRTEDPQVWKNAGFRFRGQDQPVPIRFVGVWDTVGALGVPDDMAFLNLLDNLNDYTFHDAGLGDHILSARHAIALDELRASFQPTLWTGTEGRDVKQVWFAGVHSDVGGGYRETGLSDIALLWMIREAEACGLGFNQAMVDQVRPNHQDVLHESCEGIFALFPTQPRSAPRLTDPQAPIHASVRERQASPPIHQCPYRDDLPLDGSLPGSVEVFAREPWNPTGIWLEAGKAYQFEASGEWMDASIHCGPGGAQDGHFQFAEIGHVLGSALGQAEELFKKLRGEKAQAADFRGTRRHEDMPWFCLVGAIANGGGVDAKHRLQPHEAFRIGERCRYTPRVSGYLYAYANDAWNFYGNNRGRVNLRVS